MPDQVLTSGDKRDLRLWMRRLRRDIPDRDIRGERIWEQVVSMTEVHRARRILVFTTIPGEPPTAPFLAWCEADGKETAVPEDNVDPGWPDVVVVPGLAFTADGERLGQGGGWYDRFLPGVRDDCTTIGVCFEPQLVDVLPVEPHDVRLDYVVSDAQTAPAR
jgi:5-formyltetrahydrofolate cyclo-ligase